MRQIERLQPPGLVAKEDSSPYLGGRTLSWLKVKQCDYRVAARGFPSHTNRRQVGPSGWPKQF
jgi:ATP-dependent DNA ligase